MSDLKPTQKQIELYNKMREISEPHHTYQNQIMAIAEWVDSEFTHKRQADMANKNHEQELPIRGTTSPFINYSFRDENGERQYCQVDAKNAAIMIGNMLEQLNKVNQFIVEFTCNVT